MNVMDKRSVNIAVVGAGTVGSGLLNVLAQNAETIETRAMPIRVKWLVVRTPDKGQAVLDAVGLCDTKITTDWQEVIDDPDTDIVVELIGGTTLAFDILAAALAAGKSAVTANKDLMASRGGELLHLAESHQSDLFFEAAVCGGIPIIQAVKESLSANRFHELMGIVNGTTNFILTKMSENGMDFSEALAQAQELGYAEADPTSDVEGFDAARKMAILASIAYNTRVTFDMVPCEGMTKITSWDILYAKEFGYTIKMVGIARSDGKTVDVRVHPVMLPNAHPLSTVRDSYNAVFVRGNAVENAMFYGRGAGSMPTGSAVAGDVIMAARNIMHGCQSRWGCTCQLFLPMLPLDETVSKYYIRIAVSDQVGVFAALAKALSDANVSMDAVMQKRRLPEGGAEIVMITHPALHRDIKKALQTVEGLDCTRKIGEYIRVENQID